MALVLFVVIVAPTALLGLTVGVTNLLVAIRRLRGREEPPGTEAVPFAGLALAIFLALLLVFLREMRWAAVAVLTTAGLCCVSELALLAASLLRRS